MIKKVLSRQKRFREVNQQDFFKDIKEERKDVENIEKITKI